MSDDMKRVEGLSQAEKRALLSDLLRLRVAERKAGLGDPPPGAGRPRDGGREQRAPEAPPVTPIPRDGELPLSFAQERMWFLSRLSEDDPSYNIPLAMRLTGPLDAALLERSLNEVIRRHEVLRTGFVSTNGRPAQFISPSAALTLATKELPDLAPELRESEVSRFFAEEAQRPFDLSGPPLVRAALLKLAEEEHLILLTMHHIVADAWSVALFAREVIPLYEALGHGLKSPLPPLPVQYVDYAHWQRRWLQGEVLERELAYWRGQLEGAPAVLDLPTDRPRPAIMTSSGARLPAELSAELTAALRARSRQEGSTLFMTMLAAFKTLLYRYTAQEEILVGTPVANRARPELEGLIGVFINTLVLRTDFSGDPSFRYLLARVRQTALAAYAHQDLPFEKLVEELQPARDLNRTPFFQVMFVFPQGPIRSLSLPGRTISPVDVHTGTAKFDLVLSVVDKVERLELFLEYNTALFDEGTIRRMLAHLQNILRGVVAEPERRLAELPLLGESERRELLSAWNDTDADYPNHRCLHELFEEQARSSPESIAVTFGERRLSYAELNRRANQLAHHLRGLGVGPETLVGVLLSRGLDMVIGLLAILKAGGAYVPMDSSYPTERLGMMIEDAGLGVILADGRTSEAARGRPARVVCLDADREEIAAADAENPEGGVSPDNLAYVIYTSGSTGRPKGVMTAHRTLTNYLYWVNERLLPGDVENMPVVTALPFDMSLKQVFGPLLRGREVWVLPAETMRQPSALLEAVGSRPRVGLNCVPSLWNTLLDAMESGSADPPPPGTLTHLFIGGEQLNGKLIERTFALLPNLRVTNIYGPTETTANACTAPIISPGEITIGRPIDNIKVFILDARLKPVPVGVRGELSIGGRNLGRGYLNRPALTAERFIPDPHGGAAGGRLYRSGDLARYRPDGNIELLGRLDSQLKIRSYRVEPGEVEGAINQHPLVRQSLVVAREDVAGEQRLVAYVVPRGEGGAAGNGALRLFLKEKLPEYMIPSAFVTLDALPLMPNGKVDAKALPAPPSVRPDLAPAYVEPRTEMEALVAQVWRDTLRLDKVGINDNFFDLGGNSLLAIQVQTKLQERLGREVSVLDMFKHPDVKSLGHALEQGRDAEAPAEDDGRALALDEGKAKLARLRSKSGTR